MSKWFEGVYLVAMKSYANLYLFVVIASLFLALLFPDIFSPLSTFSTQILGAIFLITALQLKVKDILKNIQHVKLIVFLTITLLIALPFVTYFVASLIVPDQALALLILASMPAGMTAPLLTKVAGGKEELSLVLAVITSLLAPITVPIVIFLAAGSAVQVEFISMIQSLVYIIFIPFALGAIIKKIWPRIERLSQKMNSISLTLLGLLIAGLVSKQAHIIQAEFLSGDIWFSLASLFGFFIILHIIGYFISAWSRGTIQIAAIVSLVYMNFTLAIYLATKFFPEPDILVTVTLSIIPWALLLAPFSIIYEKINSRH